MTLTTAGMMEELQAMTESGIYDEVQISVLGENLYRGALPTTWAKRPKDTEVRCQLVCKGCYQETTHTGDTCANTPLLISSKQLL